MINIAKFYPSVVKEATNLFREGKSTMNTKRSPREKRNSSPTELNRSPPRVQINIKK